MSRIKGRMTLEEFDNVCRNKGINTKVEIIQRHQNYLMTYNGLNDGKSAKDVGATVIEEDLYE